MPSQPPSSQRRARLVLALGVLGGALIFLVDGLAHASLRVPPHEPRATPADARTELLRALPHQRGLWPD